MDWIDIAMIISIRPFYYDFLTISNWLLWFLFLEFQGEKERLWTYGSVLKIMFQLIRLILNDVVLQASHILT